jgi:predicted metal-dependent peptidase
MLAKEGYALPAGGLRDANLEHLSTEEVYDLLQQQTQEIQLPAALADLLEGPPGATAAGDQEGRGPAERGEVEKHWAAAQRQARLAMEATVQGDVPAHLAREFGQVGAPKLDWRAYLWRYLVQTPTDYTGFDRRFVGRGLYLETLVGESVRVHVCVDTSGSVNPEHLRAFGAELQAILSAYPHLLCELYYADAKVYGPYRLNADSPLPPPIGGGGTDFRPFFQQVEATQDGWTPTLAIYLTDGFGSFPAAAPNYPVLWVVTPGGSSLDRFPFGEAVRLVLGGES